MMTSLRYKNKLDFTPGRKTLTSYDKRGYNNTLIGILSISIILITLLTAVPANAALGDFLYKWGTTGSGDGQFNSPVGIAVDSNNNVYVADTSNSRIQVFSNSGAFLRKWGGLGSNSGLFNWPMGIAVDSSGNIYVSDTLNNRIEVFSNSGAFLREWGNYGTGDGQFAYPIGIAVDDRRNIYVVDYGNNRIQVFSDTGIFLKKWGSYGTGNGQFSYARGVAVDVSGNVYVADTYNNRVQVFSNDGTFLRKWGTAGSGNGQFNYPGGLASDKAGNIYMADSGNNRIEVFNNMGEYLGQWGVYGSGDGQFQEPEGIALDSGSNVYVSNIVQYCRIQVFDGRITDTQPPVTAAMATGKLGSNGWYVSDVTISLSATDSASGVKELHYTIDGAETVVAGSTVSASITGDGTHTFIYYAIDNAGNKETLHTLTIKIDKTLPTIASSATPAANAYGWNNSDVSVAFTCNDGTSGIANCTGPVTIATEGANQVVTGTAVDNAGNTASATATVNIDKTPPTVTASVNPAPNAYGWNNTDVTVTFNCGDTLSGIASCPGPITVMTEGAGQVIKGTAVDKAGNTATASVTLNIDKTPPTISSLTVSPSILWPPNHKMRDVTVSGSVSDSGSGVASVVITVNDEYGVYNTTMPGLGSTIQLEAWREGTDMDGRHYTITAVATDKAGNQSTATATVLVPHDMR